MERGRLERLRVERLQLELTVPPDPASREPALPLRVRLLIGVAVLATAATLAAIGVGWHQVAAMTARQWAVMAVVTVMATACSVRPLLLYRGLESEAFTFSEAFLVILVLTLPPLSALAAILLFSAAAQTLKRRPLSKAVFNVGQMCTGAAAAIALAHWISPPTRNLQMGAVGAATAGAAVFFVINATAVAAVLTAIDSTWTSCLLDGIKLRLALSASGMVAGAVLGIALYSGSWVLLLLVPTLVLLRHTVAAQFKAEHDRARVSGLLATTLEAYRRLDGNAVSEAVLGSARDLLRSPRAYLSALPPGPDPAAMITVNGGGKWLVLAGRRKDEPFEETDGDLLRALAAVGSGAATNAELYRQVSYERERLASVALSIGEGVVAVDPDGRLTFANAAAGDIVALPAVTGEGDRFGAGSVRAPDFLREPALRCIRAGHPVRDDSSLFPSKDGSPVPVSYIASPIMERNNRPAGAVIAFHDVSERQMLEEKLRHQGLHDSLTGLANRRQLVQRLEALLHDPRTRDLTHAVMFIDVDRFKGVNDTLGHAVGDDLLVALGQRLKAAARPEDVIARFGGDEFVALLPDVHGLSEASAVAERMCKAVEQPVRLADDYDFVATVSVGVDLTAPGKSADDLLHNADVAMYDSKARRHGGAVQFFDRYSMGSRSPVLFQLEADLRRAVERDEIEVHYQPRFTIPGGEIVGAEALVRWRHPQLGLLGPSSFVNLAEETGLIVPVGRAMLEQAARFARDVEEELGRVMPVSVNLSPRQFHHSGLVMDIRRILREVGLDPARVTVEITESMVMDDLAGARQLMSQLRATGVNIAIDDFGTGHSSLGYLKRFPVQELKVDRSFVAGVADQPTDRAIVRTVIQLAEAMNVTPVAEGVETVEQLAVLEALGCSLGQGYYVSPPVDGPSFTRLLSAQAPAGREGASDRTACEPVVDQAGFGTFGPTA